MASILQRIDACTRSNRGETPVLVCIREIFVAVTPHRIMRDDVRHCEIRVWSLAQTAKLALSLRYAWGGESEDVARALRMCPNARKLEMHRGGTYGILRRSEVFAGATRCHA